MTVETITVSLGCKNINLSGQGAESYSLFRLVSVNHELLFFVILDILALILAAVIVTYDRRLCKHSVR